MLIALIRRHFASLMYFINSFHLTFGFNPSLPDNTGSFIDIALTMNTIHSSTSIHNKSTNSHSYPFLFITNIKSAIPFYQLPCLRKRRQPIFRYGGHPLLVVNLYTSLSPDRRLHHRSLHILANHFIPPLTFQPSVLSLKMTTIAVWVNLVDGS